jgi:hypothetical protein
LTPTKESEDRRSQRRKSKSIRTKTQGENELLDAQGGNQDDIKGSRNGHGTKNSLIDVQSQKLQKTSSQKYLKESRVPDRDQRRSMEDNRNSGEGR